MDLVPALVEAATGLIVTVVFLIRYGVILPGSRLHYLLGWRGYPFGWTPEEWGDSRER